MPTVTDICNQALSRLGEPAISDFSANEPNAIVCRAHYDTVRDSLLRSHPWNFATGRVQLSQLAAAPDFGWSYAYQLPADWLRLVTLNGREAKLCSATYVIEGTSLLTDSSEAKITYVRKITDPGVFDSLFLDVLIFRLASAIAMDVKGSSQFRDEMEQLAALRLGDANFVDANETRVEVLSPLSGSRGAAARGAYGLIGSGLAPYGPTLEQIELENGDDGAPGWTPSFAIASDGARRVLQITGWSGGEGTAPQTGYLAVGGIVASAALAVDIRGTAGAGGIVGPGSSVDNAIALFDGTDGGTVQDSGILIGTAANNVLQLNGSGQLPAVDGSLLTNLNIPTVDNAAVNTAIEEDAAATRTSLGLGTAALAATGDFATAAQGADERVPTAAGLTSKFGTNKATIADGDKIALLDSAASDAPKHGLFSLVKSTLKTYFDTLYAAALGSDDNYVTDAEKVVIGNTSGTNTGDQTNISGNAATVTTNANLTGPVTSTGNATAIANGAISNAMLANGAVANLSGTNTGDQDLSGLMVATALDPDEVIGLLCWLDASDASTLYDATSGGSLVAANGTVARWEDKSGLANDATQATSGARPVRKTAIQNGLDILRFDASDDGMTIGLSITPTTAEMTCIAVYAYTGGLPADGRVLNGSQNVLLGPYSGFYDFFTGTSFINNAVPVVVGQFVCHSGVLERTGSSTGRAIASLGEVQYGTFGGGALAFGDVYIGAGETGVSFAIPLSGDLCEVVIYNRALCPADLNRVVRGLSEKWDLTTLI